MHGSKLRKMNSISHTKPLLSCSELHPPLSLAAWHGHSGCTRGGRGGPPLLACTWDCRVGTSVTFTFNVSAYALTGAREVVYVPRRPGSLAAEAWVGCGFMFLRQKNRSGRCQPLGVLNQ